MYSTLSPEYPNVHAVYSDKTGHRGPFVLLAATWSLISYACLRTVPARSSKWHKYGVIAVANVPFATIQ